MTEKHKKFAECKKEVFNNLSKILIDNSDDPNIGLHAPLRGVLEFLLFFKNTKSLNDNDFKKLDQVTIDLSFYFGQYLGASDISISDLLNFGKSNTQIINDDRIKRMKDIYNIQGTKGHWDYDEYKHGMFNGMEAMISILENRETNYRDAPKKWGYEKKNERKIKKQEQDG